MDENKYRSRRKNPPMFRTIRTIARNDKRNIKIQGVTIPEMISKQFENVFFTIRCNNTQIILESGCPTQRFK